jgi:hypothetical protein
VSRGGRYTLENVVPACASCNAGKGHHELVTWLRRRRLDERAFWERHLEIRGLLSGPHRLGDRDADGAASAGDTAP